MIFLSASRRLYNNRSLEKQPEEIMIYINTSRDIRIKEMNFEKIFFIAEEQLNDSNSSVFHYPFLVMSIRSTMKMHLQYSNRRYA